VYKSGIELRHCTISTTLQREQPRTNNHVIITGSLFNLGYLIQTLRAKHEAPTLADTIPVVILNERPPTHNEWQKCSVFPNVYFVQGSPLEDADLYRAGLLFAATVVILAKPTHERALQNEVSVGDCVVL
jgi:hypothetical protein